MFTFSVEPVLKCYLPPEAISGDDIGIIIRCLSAEYWAIWGVVSNVDIPDIC